MSYAAHTSIAEECPNQWHVSHEIGFQYKELVQQLSRYYNS
jgi:hypothetical protein